MDGYEADDNDHEVKSRVGDAHVHKQTIFDDGPNILVKADIVGQQNDERVEC